MQRFAIDKDLSRFVGSSPVLRVNPAGPWVMFEDAMQEIDKIRAELWEVRAVVKRLEETIAEQSSVIFETQKKLDDGGV